MRDANRTIGLAAAAILAAPALGQNLLANGSFETPGPGLIELADWGVFGNAFADGPADAMNELTAQDGVRSVKMFGGFFGPGAQSDTGVFQDGIAVSAGTTYRLSGYSQVFSSDPISPADFTDPDGNFGHLALLIVDFKDGGGAVLGSAEVQMFEVGTDPFDVWVFKEVTTTAPAGTVSCQVTPLLIQWGTDPGAIFWDDIVLEEASAGCNFADCDQNGTLNIDDIDCFVAAFLSGDTALSDCDGNGTINIDDIDCFVALFLGGCP